MMSYHSPLTDITNVQINTIAKSNATDDIAQKRTIANASVNVAAPKKKTKRHDPYGWKCLPDDAVSGVSAFYEAVPATPTPEQPEETAKEALEQAPPTAHPGSPVCDALIQFKCRQTEFSSPIALGEGQYVVVQGDRGIDVGVVIRINTAKEKTFVQRTGPVGCVLRHATQSEVNYWATGLKEAEEEAVEFCRAQVRSHNLDMAIVHAEYQFDKKKLTFYYESHERIDFVLMLKELYREFACRIWMEKVRHSI